MVRWRHGLRSVYWDPDIFSCPKGCLGYAFLSSGLPNTLLETLGTFQGLPLWWEVIWTVSLSNCNGEGLGPFFLPHTTTLFRQRWFSLDPDTVSSPFLPTCSVVPPHTPVQLSIQVCLPLPPSSLPLPWWVHEARDNVCFILCCVPSTSYSAGAQCTSESKWENDRNSLTPRLPPGPGTAHQPPLSRAKFTGLQTVLGACYLLTGFWGISNTEINT